MRELIGKTTVNPFLFYSGKIAGYITWLVYMLFIFGIRVFDISFSLYRMYFSYFLALIALFLIVFSLINLGKSTRLGLPSDQTVLKTRGIYTLSRNPMYAGFDLLTFASMIYTYNVFIIILGTYSIVVYHLIILGEERFLDSRFGSEFMNYKNKTRRYL